jgi:glyoxylase-like metal-dependent hydrolase (beta-lactamase superfamily II)/rhodanese-related sulfurtransferase
LKKKIGSGSIFLLDVRERDEFKDWRIEGSENIPLVDLLSPEVRATLPRDKEIVTICSVGPRSREAAGWLNGAGFKASHLYGGLIAWSRLYDVSSIQPRPDFRIFQIKRMAKGCVSYMVCGGRSAAVIDPSIQLSEYVKLANGQGLNITNVIDTHLHADHISGAKALAGVTGAKLHLSSAEGYSGMSYEDICEDELMSIDGIQIRFLHTPGHTPGSVSLMVDSGYLLTGDFLFLDSIARPDLHGEDERCARQLYHSYHSILQSLPTSIQILPAHFGPATRTGMKFTTAALGEVRSRLTVLSSREEEFLRYVLRGGPQKPMNYSAIQSLNRTFGVIDGIEAELLEAGPNRCTLTASQ